MTREEAIEILQGAIKKPNTKDGYLGQAIDMATKALEQEPKTGHWIEKDGFDGDTYYDCSECGESWTIIAGTPWDNEWNYCPNCGAKMQEVEE